MTPQQYKNFVTTFENFMKDEGFESLHASQSFDEQNDEPFFSGMPCDCCQREGMAGNRYYAVGLEKNENSEGYTGHNVEICHDCLYFAEYGKLDDATMQEIEEQEKSANVEIPEIDINLGACTVEELEAYHKAFTGLASYAQTKAKAMRARVDGRINAALLDEEDCEAIYKRLPDAAKW